MKPVCKKVGHEQLCWSMNNFYDVYQNLLARALKTKFSPSSGFLLKYHVAHSEIMLTACTNQLLYNLSLIKLCSACVNKFVGKIDIIWSNRRTPEFINYQLWTSYKVFLSLKYLFQFFGWLHFFIRVLKSTCILL